MSLVNDALKKARLEAARGEASQRGVPYPSLGSGETPRSGLWLGALAATIAVATLAGFLLYRAGKQSALAPPVEVSVAAKSPADPARSIPGPTAGTTASPTTDPQSEPAGTGALVDRRDRNAPQQEPQPTARPANSDFEARRAATRVEAQEPAHSTSRDEGSAEVGPETRAVPAPAPTQPAVSEQSSQPATPSQAAAPRSRDQPAAPSGTEQSFLRAADVPGIGKIELAGIAWSGDRPFALVNGRVVRPGDSVAGLTVDQIEPNTVRLRGDAGVYVFRLK